MIAALTALWLGLVCAASPCPLATNVAALTFISQRLGHPVRVLLAGIGYAAGRMTTYVALGVVVGRGIAAAPGVSHALQKHLEPALGPLMILIAVVLLDLLPLRFPSLGSSLTGFKARLSECGIFGAVPLGAIFALAFCPSSAALFFGSLLPLALKHDSPALLCALFGFATALPTIALALLFACGANRASASILGISKLDRWMKTATASVFLILGLYKTIF
ncbi:MAG: aromatic aminobenezylarsenical efflux permease ArsG family transporter [Kiritimatiellia bacterium]